MDRKDIQCCDSKESIKSIQFKHYENKKTCFPVIIDNKHEWIAGSVNSPVGLIPRVSTVLSRKDYWGQIKSRISSFRMKYIVDPGLYAVGEPDRESDVFVSANYKLSFDILRRELRGLNAWLLVLDTKGINVWCAAGKGTFGSNELVRRINEVYLDKVVNHKRIIVPQLSAPGVNAYAIQKSTGFRVYFGPVYAKDIPDYIKANYKKSKEMSTIRFTMLDRIILTPMEIIPALKRFPPFALIVLIIFAIQPSGVLLKDILLTGIYFPISL